MKRCIRILFLLPALLFAAEGMYLLDAIPEKSARKAGMKLKASQIYSPDRVSLSDAIVRISGGSGSFVSPEGLVVTNHHVGFRAIQELSTPENNILEEGYYARTRDMELYADGYRVIVTLDFTDVTEQIMQGVSADMNPIRRVETTEANIRNIVREAEREQDIHAAVKSMYSGSRYYLFRTMEFEDVRLVHCPPRNIGEFGGDIDNWMWPRHTGDFSFFRVYAAPDGRPAAYSEDNIPYRPKNFLHFSSRGVKEGDFTMILGYPGSTQRHLTADYAEFTVNTSYPRQIRDFEWLIKSIETLGQDDEAAALKLQSSHKGINNYLKKYQGMLAGFKRQNIIDHKRTLEAELLKKSASSRSAAADYADLKAKVDALQAEKQAEWPLRYAMGRVLRYSRLVGAAHSIYRFTAEQIKADSLRDLGYMDRDLPRHLYRTRTTMKSYYEPYDRAVLKYFLMQAAELPEGMTLEALNYIRSAFPDMPLEQAVDTFLDQLYENTQFADTDFRVKAYGMSKQELLDLQDPLIEFVRILESQEALLREKDRIRNGEQLLIMPRYTEALAELLGEALYPDANGSIRFTYGKVEGFSPADAVNYSYMTSLQGMLDKFTGSEPFDLNADYRELAGNPGPDYRDSRIGDIPLNFLHTTDITNGNSGSAVMNARGEFIGTAFDGNWEAMTSDWNHDPSLTRSISVDSRYILFILDKYSNARALLEELSIR